MRPLKLFAILSLFSSVSAVAHDRFEGTTIGIETLKPGYHVLTGQGGNMLLQTGADGNLLIDDQYAPLAPKILAAVDSVAKGGVRYLLNTHWHGDHTGGNEAMGRSGAVIVAHDNVRARMATEQDMKVFNRVVPASPSDALPVVTYKDRLTLHHNGVTISMEHLMSGHTDGDSIVFFKEPNIVHMGDMFFNGLYPFIDAGSGGSINNMIDTVNAVLARVDENTIIVPGHGPVAGKGDLVVYRDMLQGVRTKLLDMRKQGMTDEQIVEAKPTAELDEQWNGFLKGPRWVKIVLLGL